MADSATQVDGGGVGVGGGGLHFRTPPDIFTGADLAATRTARDTYFATAAGTTALPFYQGDQSLAIILRVTGATDNVFETYAPGQVGNAYDNTQWVSRTDAVQGNVGPQGRFPVYEYVSLGATPTIAGAGSFNLTTSVQTPTAGTSIAPTRPTVGQDVYVREAYVDDKTDAGLVDLSARWSVWVERAHLSGGISHVEHSTDFGGTGLPVDPLTLDAGIARDTELAQLIADLSLTGRDLTVTRQDGGSAVITIGGIAEVEHSGDFGGTGAPADPLTLDDAITRDTEIAQLISNLSAVGFVITITRQDGTTDTLDIPDDLVDVTDTGLPVLTAENYKKLFANHDTPRVWVGRRRYTSRTPATGNFIDYTASNYEGEHTSGGEPAPLHHGHRYYNVTRHVWRRVITNSFGFNVWADIAWANLFSSGAWLGEELDDATAVNLISGFDSTATWMYYNRTSFSVEILDPTSYVAPVDPVPVFVAEPISAPTGVGSVAGVTAGAGIAGGGLSGVVSISIDVTKSDFPIIPINKGGTGAATAADARTALGITAGGITFHYGPNAPLPVTGEVGDPFLRTSNGAWYTKTAQGWGSPVYTDRVGAGGSGQTESQVNVLIATAFGDAFTNNTESRITATYNSDGTVDLVVSAPNFLTGSGVPDDANDGANGDLYLQTNGAWYQKANDAWGTAIYTPSAAGQRGVSVQFIYQNAATIPIAGSTDITVDANGIIDAAPTGWGLDPVTPPSGQRTWAQEITVSGSDAITYGTVAGWSGETGSQGLMGSSVQFIYTNAADTPTFINSGVTADSSGILNFAPDPWTLSPTVPPAGTRTYVQQIRVTGVGGIVYSRPTAWSGTPGLSIYVGYSVDGLTLWHATLATADRYIRTVRASARPAEGSATWSVAVRFVGRDGNDSVGGVITATAGMARESILTTSAAISANGTTEVTLTKDIATGEMLSFFLAGTGGPGAYAIAMTTDILGRNTRSTAPSRGDSNGLPIEIHNPTDEGFGHDTMYIWRSDEANKLWISTGRDVARSLAYVYRHYVDVTVSSSGGPTRTHALYVGWSVDGVPAEIEFTANSDTHTVTIPTGVGNLYLMVWRSDADGGDPSEVHLAGGGNARNTFGAAADFTLNSIPGKVIISITTQNAGFLSGETLRAV